MKMKQIIQLKSSLNASKAREGCFILLALLRSETLVSLSSGIKESREEFSWRE
jgi:hypothetical protein